MANFGKNSQKNKPDSSSMPGSNQQASAGGDIATAEYSCFYTHQIKAWSSWAVDQAEISYTVDAPRILNAEGAADV